MRKEYSSHVSVWVNSMSKCVVCFKRMWFWQSKVWVKTNNPTDLGTLEIQVHKGCESNTRFLNLLNNDSITVMTKIKENIEKAGVKI